MYDCVYKLEFKSSFLVIFLKILVLISIVYHCHIMFVNGHDIADVIFLVFMLILLFVIVLLQNYRVDVGKYDVTVRSKVFVYKTCRLRNLSGVKKSDETYVFYDKLTGKRVCTVFSDMTNYQRFIDEYKNRQRCMYFN